VGISTRLRFSCGFGRYLIYYGVLEDFLRDMQVFLVRRKV